MIHRSTEAYAELLSQFKTINSIPIPLDPKNNFTITLQELRREIVGRGLSVLLLSNPCNPTGQLIEGEELKNWCRIARETQCSLVLDEIYSRYIYTQRMSPTDATWRMVSAAQFVDDVNQDPVIILDGLTKCWRMPGLRICWIVAPKSVSLIHFAKLKNFNRILLRSVVFVWRTGATRRYLLLYARSSTQLGQLVPSWMAVLPFQHNAPVCRC